MSDSKEGGCHRALIAAMAGGGPTDAGGVALPDGMRAMTQVSVQTITGPCVKTMCKLWDKKQGECLDLIKIKLEIARLNWELSTKKVVN